MKKILLILSSALLLGIFLSSCTEEEDMLPDQVRAQIESNLESGTWKISLFEDSGKNETGHFSGYNFTFGSDGTLAAENDMNQFRGTWSISDSGSNDDSADNQEFIIFFNLSNDFEELNEDWDIITHGEVKIELIHISGGNGGTDYLTFEKN